MTSRELVLRTLERQPTDRVPVGPMMLDLAATVIGAPVGRFCVDPDVMARGQLALHEQLGQDIIFVGCDNYYIAEGFGCVAELPRGQQCAAQREPAAHHHRAGGCVDVVAQNPQN